MLLWSLTNVENYIEELIGGAFSFIVAYAVYKFESNRDLKSSKKEMKSNLQLLIITLQNSIESIKKAKGKNTEYANQLLLKPGSLKGFPLVYELNTSAFKALGMNKLHDLLSGSKISDNQIIQFFNALEFIDVYNNQYKELANETSAIKSRTYDQFESPWINFLKNYNIETLKYSLTAAADTNYQKNIADIDLKLSEILNGNSGDLQILFIYNNYQQIINLPSLSTSKSNFEEAFSSVSKLMNHLENVKNKIEGQYLIGLIETEEIFSRIKDTLTKPS